MTSTLCILLPLVALAVALDIFFVTGWQRFRKLKKESTGEDGVLKISKRELWGRSFLPATYKNEWKKTFLYNSKFRKRFRVVVELTLIAIWAVIVGNAYLDMNPRIVPVGNEFGSAIQSHHLWTQFQRCGLCALWNGFERGGFPAFADIQGSMLHPFVIVTTWFWGVVNGVKISLILALWCAGLAQWWIASELKLGWLPRMWSAAIAVAGGHLAGRLELGVFGVVLATAMGSLVFAGILHLENARSKRAAVLLGLVGALAILSGQGYMQVGMLGILPAVLILLFRGGGKFAPHWKYYLLAFILAALLASPLLVPLLHFGPNIAKDMDPEFKSAQPLEFFVLNLVIDDPSYFRSDVLGKLPYPYLYSLYIGWVPVLLAVFGISQIRRAKSRMFWFLIAGIILSFLVASAIVLKPLADLFPSVAGIRHSPQIASLAIPLILALSAYGLERLLNLRWPDLFMSFPRTKSQSGLFSLRWVLLVPLLFSLKSSYDFSQLWIETTYRNPEIYELLALLKTETVQWVEPPFGEHAFIEPAIDMGLKLSPGIMTWSWRGREKPAAFRYLSRTGQPPGAVAAKGMIRGLTVFESTEEKYAEVYAGESRYPCWALGSGGVIDVSCKTGEAGTLVLKEYTFSGWRVWVDGKPARFEFDDVWLKVQAPAGTHTYAFRYFPWDVPFGVFLWLCGLVICVLLWRSEHRAVPTRHPKAS
jgi:hypothetical protein